MVYTCKPKKVSIYVNREKKSIAQVKAETGCTAVINGGLYDMATFQPACHLKVDGQVLAADKYKYWGLAWNTVEDMTLANAYDKFANYLACVCLIRNGKAETLLYASAMGGYRPRTAFGVFPDGRVWLYADSTGRTPENLQKLALAAGVKHAIMLDGGGSTQWAVPGDAVAAARRVHNFLCVWEEEETKEEEEPAMFKIALGAGHGASTPGKRCDKALDPNQTSEWWLNDRIADYVEDGLKAYTGYELLRLDDSDDGKDDIALATRVSKANAWGADFYLSVHHNAGANLTNAGGICAFTHPQASAVAVKWRDAMYDELIKQTGLKGNRAQPKTTGNFYVLRCTKMPAVLLELGFMDSKVDVPIILTNDFAKKCAKAIVAVLVARGGLKKKQATQITPEASEVLYRVQVGAFSSEANAEKLEKELQAKGYQAYITTVKK